MCYPNRLADSFEAISYALSYDETNPDVHCLMGRFYMEQLEDFEVAKYHFEMALLHDINHINTYYQFIGWSIDTNHFKRGLKLIDYAQNIEGICHATLFHRTARLYEKKGNLKKAKKHINKAIQAAIYQNDFNYFKREKARIKSKLNQLK